MQRIKIDFDNPGLPKRLDVMKNDAQSRFFEAELYRGGKAYSAPSGATYSIMYHGFGPQNEGWYDIINDGAGKRAACTVSGNVVTCEIARQALQVPGHMTVILCVTDPTGYMLKGWPITANVRNDDYNDGEEVEMYFNLSGNVSNSIDQLKKAIAEAEQAKKDIETKAAEALASIPEDYTKLDSNVKQLKEDLGHVATIIHSANLMNPSKIQNGLIGYGFGSSVTDLTENPNYYSIIFDGTFPKGTVFVFSRELGVDYPYQRFIQFNQDTNIVSASYRVQDKGDTGLYEIVTTENNRGIAITFGRTYKDLYVATKSSYLENPKILPYGKTDGAFLAKVGTDNLESKSVTVEKLNDDVIELINPKNDNPCDYEGGDISTFDTCVCIGDSLTEGIFNVNRLESSKTYSTMSYPTYLQKITGVNVTNKGSGGKTTVTWWNTFKNTDLSGYKMAIIALGVNDYYSYGSGWTTEANESLGNIVQKLQNENNNIKIFVSTILPAKYYPASQYTKISQGIRDFVKNKNDANVICLDIAKYGHTNDKDAYNTGHLSAYGYWRLAKDYANYVSWYMNSNSEVFKEIQFIGTDLTSGY